MPHNKISLFRYYAAWDSFQLVCRKTLHSNKINTPGEHSHDDFYELVIVAAGQGRHRTENSEWIIQPGNVFLIKPRQQHCYTEYDNMIIYNLLFSPSFITRVLPDLIPRTDYGIDYGLWGVLLPVFIFLGRTQKEKLLLSCGGLVLLAIFFRNLGAIQWFSLLTLPLLALYNGQRGKRRMKYFFYVYYPLHLVVIYGISLVI